MKALAPANKHPLSNRIPGSTRKFQSRDIRKLQFRPPCAADFERGRIAFEGLEFTAIGFQASRPRAPSRAAQGYCAGNRAC